MTFTVPAQDADATTKVGAVDDAFLYQFGEVDKAIANFTKHQPFNHHYAPNVHMNRGRNNHHHNNGGRQNSGNGYNHSNNNNNNSSSSNNVNNNNGMFQSPANFAMTAQLKQQQHQQFLNQGLQNINRLKSSNGLLSGGPNQQMKTHQLQQQQQQQQVYMPQQQAPQQQQQYYDNRSAYNGNSLQASNFYSGNPLVNKFSAFQNQSAISTGDMLSPLRASPPAFPTGFANESPQFGSPQFSAPFDHPLESTTSLGMNGSGFLNVTSPNQQGSSADLNVNNNKYSLEQNNSGYLGNIWGDSKSLGSSTSVWA